MLTPSQKLASIINTIASYNLQPGIENALAAKLLAALADINSGQTTGAVDALQA